FGRILHEAALFEAEKDGVGIVGRKEAAALRCRRDVHPLAVLVLDENAVEPRALVLASVDAHREVAAKLVEFADLDRSAERAGLQIEAKPFVAIVSVRLEIADDAEVDD